MITFYVKRNEIPSKYPRSHILKRLIDIIVADLYARKARHILVDGGVINFKGTYQVLNNNYLAYISSGRIKIIVESDLLVVICDASVARYLLMTIIGIGLLVASLMPGSIGGVRLMMHIALWVCLTIIYSVLKIRRDYRKLITRSLKIFNDSIT